jgi:hypothetical protein
MDSVKQKEHGEENPMPHSTTRTERTADNVDNADTARKRIERKESTMAQEEQLKEEECSGSNEWQRCFIADGKMYLNETGNSKLLTNYSATIQTEKIILDEGQIMERRFELAINKGGIETPLTVGSDEFFSSRLPKKVVEALGYGAITYCTPKMLSLAIQEASGDSVPKRVLSNSIGFTPDGNYLAKGILIAPSGIDINPSVEINLEGTSFARYLTLLSPDPERIKALGSHICSDFLKLKQSDVAFPLMGHICLAPFSSQIYAMTGKSKPALHLLGASGAGKTHLGILAQSFFGHFEDRTFSWTSTPNAIEAEGYYFRDSLILVNDFKQSCVDLKAAIRVFQGYADGGGKSRLKPNSKLQNTLYIRGLLLSTGEDFVTGIESVSGRTIILKVTPEKNQDAGMRCLANRQNYPMFITGLIQSVIADRQWKENFRAFVAAKVAEFHEKTMQLSNGLRTASNWALNAFGFHMFANYLTTLGVIDEKQRDDMLAEYNALAIWHLDEQVNVLKSESPVEIFFRILGQKIVNGSATIQEEVLKSERGTVIGLLKKKGQSIIILPDVAMEVISRCLKTNNECVGITRDSLREALSTEGLIIKPSDDRWAKQVRGPGGSRLQGWEFNTAVFMARCGLDEKIEPATDAQDSEDS